MERQRNAGTTEQSALSLLDYAGAPSGLRADHRRPVAFRELVMSLVSMTATTGAAGTEHAAPARAEKSRLARLAWPTLGLVLPVTLAAGWEIAVGMGLSTGRLLPPPSVIFDTFLDLASTGELQAHTLATVMRVAA